MAEQSIVSETYDNIRAGIVDLLKTTVLLNGQEAPVSASLGIVAYPLHGADPATLLRRSELALSAATHSTVGYAIYTADQERACRGRSSD